MDDLCELFRSLRFQPLSQKELAEFQRTAEILQRCYVSSEPCDLLIDNPSWTEYAEKLPRIGFGIDSRVPESRRGLVQGAGVTEYDTESYLKLLKKTPLSADISQIIPKQDLSSTIDSLDRDRTIIVPVRDEQGWAFAVAYPHCIHWYDSKPTKAVPEFASGWCGPQSQENNDSGVLMLLGIRRLAMKFPHVDDEDIERTVSSFRTRLLLELICGHLNPDTDEVTALHLVEGNMDFLPSNDGPESESPQPAVVEQTAHSERSHFSNAEPTSSESPHCSGEDLPVDSGELLGEEFHSSSLDHPMDSGELLSEEARSSSSEQPSTIPTNSSIQLLAISAPAISPTARMANLASPRPTINLSYPRPQIYPTMMLAPDIRKPMLEILREAVAAIRRIEASNTTDLKDLWSWIRDGLLSSEFHRRYHRVLLHEKLKDASNSRKFLDMDGSIESKKAATAEGRLWGELCTFGEQQYYKYVMLCAIPKKDPISERSLNIFKNSFKSNPDLKWALAQAQELCKAIVGNQLPKRLLMIESYSYESYRRLDDRQFASYAFLPLKDDIGDSPVKVSELTSAM
ncbi:hypothetical protein EDB81DRAFT_893397 [Dactylonectria macrodidyma]|uniref:Uncharacterized protein n=1 Tax=Dactylonectria macrodidyma TaxID=307937 RepID=A0A9P9I9X4_9HYPO|nr:hypothetical protein EDB81DRAFT_893397 [Dactylonectria macrodidyma]